MRPDFSTTPELDFTTEHVLADVATVEFDTRLLLTEQVHVDADGARREVALSFMTPEMADLVTTLPMDSLRALRDALTEVIEGGVS